jgi:hypothetical protein
MLGLPLEVRDAKSRWRLAGAPGGMNDVTSTAAAARPETRSGGRARAPARPREVLRLRAGGVARTTGTCSTARSTARLAALAIRSRRRRGTGRGRAGAGARRPRGAVLPLLRPLRGGLRDLPHLCGTAWPLMAGGLLDPPTRLRFGGAEVHHYCFLSTFVERWSCRPNLRPDPPMRSRWRRCSDCGDERRRRRLAPPACDRASGWRGSAPAARARS